MLQVKGRQGADIVLIEVLVGCSEVEWLAMNELAQGRQAQQV